MKDGGSEPDTEEELEPEVTTEIDQEVLQERLKKILGTALKSENDDDAAMPLGPGAAKEVYKPDCSTLPSAIVFDKKTGEAIEFLAVLNDPIVLEYPDAWRATAKFCVAKMWDDGNVSLWDPAKLQYAMTNWKDAHKHGIKIYMSRAHVTVYLGPRKRGRPKKIVIEAPVQANQTNAVPLEPVKKKRGRPKGSKNKASVIAQAKFTKIVS